MLFRSLSVMRHDAPAMRWFDYYGYVHTYRYGQDTYIDGRAKAGTEAARKGGRHVTLSTKYSKCILPVRGRRATCSWLPATSGPRTRSGPGAFCFCPLSILSPIHFVPYHFVPYPFCSPDHLVPYPFVPYPGPENSWHARAYGGGSIALLRL